MPMRTLICSVANYSRMLQIAKRPPVESSSVSIDAILCSSSTPGDSSATRALRIVIADDDPDMVLTLSTLLQDEGHEVREVYSGRHVMGNVIDFDPDVVLLDIGLPGPSGWEVAGEIRRRCGTERPMLIGISGEYREGADRILSQILGFNHYLLKPCAPADLLKLLAGLG
jgi:two-component system, OmpR family, response regulator